LAFSRARWRAIRRNTSGGVGGVYNDTPGYFTPGFSLGVTAAENPTLSIVPMQGREFTERVLTPMDENHDEQREFHVRTNPQGRQETEAKVWFFTVDEIQRMRRGRIGVDVGDGPALFPPQYFPDSIFFFEQEQFQRLSSNLCLSLRLTFNGGIG
jgi:hypothetical protein